MAKSKVKKNLNECAGTMEGAVNEEKVVTKKTKRLPSWLPYPIIAVVAISIGAGAGIFAKRKFGQEQIDYSNFDASSLTMDSKELLKQFEANPNADYSPAELVNIGLEKYRQCENSYSFCVGTASTIVDQSIRNAQIKNGDTYFEEQLSKSSMVSIANRLVTTTNAETTEIFRGTAEASEVASYDGSKETFSNEELTGRILGRSLQDMFIYTISDDTMYDDSTVETLANGNKKIYIHLDPDLSTYFYKIQMKGMSDLDDLPTFNYVKLTYTFSSDMTLLHCYVEEKYQATMGVTASITNTIHNYYHANEYLKIPELGEQFSYSTKGEETYE